MAEYNPESEQPSPSPKHLSARVPDMVAKGCFSTGVVVMGTPTEIVLDFLQTLLHPSELVERVVLPWHTVPSLIQAMQQNLDNHEKRFGGSSEFENEFQESQPDEPDSDVHNSGSNAGDGVGAGSTGSAGSASMSIDSRQEDAASQAKKFYDDLKYDENVLVGSYSNGAMINHSEFEFKIDFLCSLQPYPIVTARIFLSKPQFHRLYKSLQEHENKRRGSE